ncbi:MAG: hypothetical protein JXR39_08850, partial [Marinilabiliaceae bacterium]|nr:hypothetical protein [Marinilabiliaceae bacterium]
PSKRNGLSRGPGSWGETGRALSVPMGGARDKKISMSKSESRLLGCPEAFAAVVPALRAAGEECVMLPDDPFF